MLSIPRILQPACRRKSAQPMSSTHVCLTCLKVDVDLDNELMDDGLDADEDRDIFVIESVPAWTVNADDLSKDEEDPRDLFRAGFLPVSIFTTLLLITDLTPP
ncbi:hypothetical protein BGZ99_007536 [Dissophora globulifera]|uniref:Uncharacterized protein n=1 Tax=Dissophora globulifera TaxID=979702 RepID=A0A9P6RDK6_9FUNG|nr:hypothetical protein BGZ99_007536 [Dissophora globulifera]